MLYTPSRLLSTGLAGIQVREPLGVSLVAGGDFLLGPGFLVAVPDECDGVRLGGVALQLVAVWQLAVSYLECG